MTKNGIILLKSAMPLTSDSGDIPLFKFYAPDLRLSGAEEGGTPRIEGIASSTTRDSHGDEITLKALQKMASNAVGLPVMLNHDYTWPEDQFGFIERAWITRGENDGKGNPIYDMRIGVGVLKSSQRAMDGFAILKEGKTKLGFSIGAMVPDGAVELIKDGAGGRYRINDLRLAEVSLVPIPAHPRAMVEYATKSVHSIFKAAKASLKDEDGNTQNPPEVPGEVTGEEAGTEIKDHTEPDVTAPADGKPEGVEELDESAENADATTSDDTSADPDAIEGDDIPLTKSTVSIWEDPSGAKTIEVNTGRRASRTPDANLSSQGDDEVTPESESGSVSADAGAVIKSGTTGSVPSGQFNLVKALNAQIEAKDQQLADSQRVVEAAVAFAAETVQKALLVAEQLMKTPMGRKTSVVEAKKALDDSKAEVTALESFARKGIYDAEMMQLITKGVKK